MNGLIEIARGDRKLCERLKNDLPDEWAMRIALYHIQQGVEKLLKCYILFYGEEPPYTHDIGRLCGICQKLNIQLPEDLPDIADTLTLWESKSRYDPYVTATIEKYEKACKVFDELETGISLEMQQYQEENNSIER